MNFVTKQSDPARRRRAPLFLAATFASLLGLVASAAQAFPSLNLTPALPDISSPSQIRVTYSYDSGTGIGALTAFGGISQLNLPPSQGAAGTFDLNAMIDTTNTTATGSLVINGLSGAFSGDLLTGTLSAFGAGPNDPLEFLFTGLGGSVAPLFGGTAGVLLANTGFTGSLTQNFSTAGSTASADTFAVTSEPGTLALLLIGAAAVARGRRSASTA